MRIWSTCHFCWLRCTVFKEYIRNQNHSHSINRRREYGRPNLTKSHRGTYWDCLWRSTCHIPIVDVPRGSTCRLNPSCPRSCSSHSQPSVLLCLSRSFLIICNSSRKQPKYSLIAWYGPTFCNVSWNRLFGWLPRGLKRTWHSFHIRETRPLFRSRRGFIFPHL